MKTTRFFGYGSLMNLESLQSTVPGSHALTLGYIKGFRRDFSKWDAAGFKHSNQDVGRIPYCAVDVEQVDDPGSRVNGVLFSVDQPRQGICGSAWPGQNHTATCSIPNF